MKVISAFSGGASLFYWKLFFLKPNIKNFFWCVRLPKHLAPLLVSNEASREGSLRFIFTDVLSASPKHEEENTRWERLKLQINADWLIPPLFGSPEAFWRYMSCPAKLTEIGDKTDLISSARPGIDHQRCRTGAGFHCKCFYNDHIFLALMVTYWEHKEQEKLQ